MTKAISILDNLLLSRKDLNKALFERPQSLGGLLPYDEYLDGYGIFANQDGSIGAIFEIDLLEHEPLSVEAISKLIDGTKAWFKLPGDCVLQVIHSQSEIESRDPVWSKYSEAYPYAHKVSRMILESKIEHLKHQCKKDSSSRPLKRSTILSIRYFPQEQKRIMGFLKGIKEHSILNSELEKTLEQIEYFVAILKDIEEASPITLKRWDIDDLCNNLRQFFNPCSFYDRSFAPVQDSIPIRSQLIYNKPELSFTGISREGKTTKSISLKTCPKMSVPGSMSEFLKMNFPYRIVMNFSFPTRESLDNKLKLKTLFLEKTPSFRGQKQLEELRDTQKKIADGDRCLNMSMSVIIDGESQIELDARQRKILNVFNNKLGCEAIVEEDIGLGVCLNSLPLMYSPETDLSTQRYFKVLQSDAQNFLPIFDSFRGTKEFQQLFLSRENNVIPFSFKNSNRTSHHTCIVAHTGSGKSSLVADIVQAHKQMVPDPNIFYIEKRASSKFLAKYYDGEVAEFSGLRNMSFSPFRGKFDDDKVKFLNLIILAGIKQLNEGFIADSDHSAILSEGLKRSYVKKLDEASISFEEGDLKCTDGAIESTISMEDVVGSIGELKDDPDFSGLDSHIDEMLTRLRDFYGTGKYRDLFRSVPADSATNNCSFYVYDFDGLENDPVLQNLVTLSVFEEIRRVVSLPENRGRGGIIVFEEIGQLGKNNPTAAKFVADYAETIRKLGVSLIACAPNVEHYFEIEAGRSMWNASDNFFFLVMADDSVDYLLEKSNILTKETSQVVKDLKLVPGEFAECFYTDKSKDNMGAFRFFRSPIDRWVCPSNDEDNKIATTMLSTHEGTGAELLDKLTKINLPGGAHDSDDA